MIPNSSKTMTAARILARLVLMLLSLAADTVNSLLEKWKEGVRSKFSANISREKTTSCRKLDQPPTFSTGC